MAFVHFVRNLLRHRRLVAEMHFGHGSDELRQLTVEFCDAGALAARLRRAGHLFAFIWSEGDDRASDVRVMSWLNMMEADAALSERFRKSWVLLLSELNATPLFAGAADGPRGLRRRAPVHEHLFIPAGGCALQLDARGDISAAGRAALALGQS